MVAIHKMAREELKKFFQIAAIRAKEGKQTGMPACYLDVFWHQLLKKPMAYEKLCTDAVGAHVDHLPYNGVGVLEWVPNYEAMFGALPSIWFTDSNGMVNEAMRAEYLERNCVRASWDCGPAIRNPGEVKRKELVRL